MIIMTSETVIPQAVFVKNRLVRTGRVNIEVTHVNLLWVSTRNVFIIHIKMANE